jgi:hypothetical protein
VAENSDPPVLTYMFQRNVEIPLTPSAKSCRCPLGQRPLRGRCQRTPSHVPVTPAKVTQRVRSSMPAATSILTSTSITPSRQRATKRRLSISHSATHSQQSLGVLVSSSGQQWTASASAMANPFFKGPETRRGDFPVTGFGKPFPCSGDQRTQEATEIGGSGGGRPTRARAFRPSQRRSDALPNAENRLAGIACETSLGSVGS